MRWLKANVQGFLFSCSHLLCLPDLHIFFFVIMILTIYAIHGLVEFIFIAFKLFNYEIKLFFVFSLILALFIFC